jgi:tetratricopeptide (TPR) repeat protein
MSFRRAEVAFDSSVRDPARQGFLLAMRAVLALDRSENDQALRLIRRARHSFKEAGDTPSVARCLLQESNVLFQLGRSAEAVNLLDLGAPMAASIAEPRLSFAVHANRAAYLVDLERFAEARRSVALARAELSRVPGRLDRIRLAWIEAQMDAALGNLPSAEERLKAVRGTFLSSGLSHEFAIVTLELALVLARSGRFTEAKEAAREAIPILQSLGIGPETVLAVRLYVESSAAEAAQISVLEDLIRRLKRRPASTARSG